MFVLNENVVYPAHGVAKIARIFEKSLAGSPVTLFELKFLHKDTTILVPVDNMVASGIRKISSPETVTAIWLLLSQEAIGKESQCANWNKRNKDYQCKLSTGNVYDICTIYRDLMSISAHKELSFGEKILLGQTEMLLAQEIALVKKIEIERIVQDMRNLFHQVYRVPYAATHVSKTL